MSGTYTGTVTGRAGVNATNSPLFQLRAGSTSRLYVVSWTLTLQTAQSNAPQYVLARATAVGTSSTTVAGTPLDPAETAANGTLDSAWSGAPTFTTTGPWLWAMTGINTIGNGFAWTAPNYESRIVVPASGGIILATLNASGTTTGAHTFTITWEE